MSKHGTKKKKREKSQREKDKIPTNRSEAKSEEKI
jgi:hypothetical protein